FLAIIHRLNVGGNAPFCACYYGNECSFTFYDSKGVLNIRTPEGTVYVYKKATPPQGQTTCSLRREVSTGGSAATPMPVSPTTPSSSHSQTQHKCTVCGGTGQVIRLHYGAGQKKWCEQCRQEVSTGHRHEMCTQCYGKGYVEY
ncbi:MAG: hypothetical protein LUD17_11840, partial [Bacteroidales bacterium]|nr:hypothetical protein [Bacteroidales bacterium]